MNIKIVPIFFLVILLSSCSKSEKVYLEKNNMYGEWEKTAIMFGYYDNYDACMEINKALTEKYPSNIYRCLPNNNTVVSIILNAVKD